MARPKVPATKRSVDFLYETYRKLNAKYWDNRLPQEVLIQVVPGGRIGYGINCRHSNPLMEEGFTTEGSGAPHTQVVELQELMLAYPPYAKVVLAHEQIHVSGIYGHGKAFKEQVERLAKAGLLLELLK